MKQFIINFLRKIQLKTAKKLSKNEPTVLYPKHTIKRKPPFNHTGKGFEHEFEQEIWEMRLHELENVQVHIARGIVFEGRRVLLDSFIVPEHQKMYFNFYDYAFLQLKGKKLQLPAEETYIVANNVWAHGLFHWVLDALPRLYPLRERAKDLILLLPAHYEENDVKKGWTPFHKESLAPFGFKAIVEVEENQVAHVPRLLMTSHMAITGNYNVEIMHGMRQLYHDYFVHQYPKPLVNLGERIYVTRTKALWRKVKNDDAVMQIMKEHNFAIVNFEDYTFAEKLQIVFHARYFVGIFSSGQTMATFMQPNSFLLDFRLDDNANLAIYSLCDAMNVHYLYQIGKAVDLETDNVERDQQKWNMEVDIEQLKKNLALMFGTKQ
ncbi:MAG: glycosyltransferase family 61 protein [Bacteroidetes bacterium]|nr:MAG: glycosyltransferase family 61 protein [Bacteroidota bacterium]